MKEGKSGTCTLDESTHLGLVDTQCPSAVSSGKGRSAEQGVESRLDLIMTLRDVRDRLAKGGFPAPLVTDLLKKDSI